MDVRDLKPYQLDALIRRTTFDLEHYRRLRARMDERGWATDCPAYIAAAAAEKALADLLGALQASRSEALGATWAVMRAAGYGKHGVEGRRSDANRRQ